MRECTGSGLLPREHYATELPSIFLRKRVSIFLQLSSGLGTFNQVVVGSIPTGLTNKIKDLRENRRFLGTF